METRWIAGKLALGLALCVLIQACDKETPTSPDKLPRMAPETRAPVKPVPKLNPSSSFAAGLPAPLADVRMRPGGACSVGAINDESTGVVSAGSGSVLKVVGWGVIPRTESVPVAVLLELSSEQGGPNYYAIAESGISRPDVAKVLKKPSYEAAGFRFSGGLDTVPPGSYEVNLILFDGSANLNCPGKKQLKVE